MVSRMQVPTLTTRQHALRLLPVLSHHLSATSGMHGVVAQLLRDHIDLLRVRWPHDAAGLRNARVTLGKALFKGGRCHEALAIELEVAAEAPVREKPLLFNQIARYTELYGPDPSRSDGRLGERNCRPSGFVREMFQHAQNLSLFGLCIEEDGSATEVKRIWSANHPGDNVEGELKSSPVATPLINLLSLDEYGEDGDDDEIFYGVVHEAGE